MVMVRHESMSTLMSNLVCLLMLFKSAVVYKFQACHQSFLSLFLPTLFSFLTFLFFFTQIPTISYFFAEQIVTDSEIAPS